MSRVEARLETAGTSRPRRPTYSPRNRLRRDMVKDHPTFELFVTGFSTNCATSFFCTKCERDVSMETRGAGERARHFFGPRHWERDVLYRVRHNLPVFNRLMDPLELSSEQRDRCLSRPCREKPGGFSFPEDLLPACVKVDSGIPLMTLVSSLSDLLKNGGGGCYVLVRKLWGSFRAILEPDNPLYNLH